MLQALLLRGAERYKSRQTDAPSEQYNLSDIPKPQSNLIYTNITHYLNRILTTFTTTMSSTTTTSSTSSLHMTQPRQTTPKDYESSFGHLSSQYGFGGSVPSLPRKTTKSTKSSSQTTKSPVTTTQSTSSSRTQPQKDYESSFGQLSSSYGFGGFSLPTRQ